MLRAPRKRSSHDGRGGVMEVSANGDPQLPGGKAPRRRIGRGVVLATAASAAFVLSGYAVNVWLGRLLGPEEYGRFAVVVAVMTLLNVAQHASVPQAIARAVASDRRSAPAELRIGLALQTAFGLLLALGLYVAAPLFAR